jgi:methylated-DNA-[protein]-cysteine S-methyltransferase
MPRAAPRRYEIAASPIGKLLLVADEHTLLELRFAGSWETKDIAPDWRRGGELLARVQDQLAEYFAGTRREFELPLAPEGTEFQHRVWHTLRAIPFGATISYMELARRIGEPAAIRAVGSANGRNPIPVIIPCHRVIGSDGSMIGFGGGIELKKRLLQLEQMALPFRLEAES